MAAEQIVQSGKRFKIIPPPAAQVIPDKFVHWEKEVRRRLQVAGLGGLKLERLMNENGHLSLGYQGTYELVGRLRNILLTDN
jgi:hypothetical protein